MRNPTHLPTPFKTALLALPILLLGACDGDDLTEPTTHHVAYEISGTTTGGDITLANPKPEGGTEQMNIVLPYTFGFSGVQPGTSLYVSAQNVRGGSKITCTIYVDGKVVKRATSLGRYSIADCSTLLD
jgi:hypothetical protein